MNPEDARSYEVGFHIIPTLSEDKIAEAVEAVRTAITQAEGTITKEEAPKFRRLAYEMRKKIDAKYETYDSAYFAYIIFDAAPEAVAKIKDALDITVSVLRYLIVKDPVLDRIQGVEEDEEEAPVTAEAAEAVEAVAEVDSDITPDISDDELNRSIDKITGDEAPEGAAETAVADEAEEAVK